MNVKNYVEGEPVPTATEEDVNPECAVCNHALYKNGKDWECVRNCRCTMRGCVPKLAKFDKDK